MLKRTKRPALRLAIAGFAFVAAAHGAAAAPFLVVDADSGQTLVENQATQPWFPASLTKLMTTYVALKAVRDGRLTMDTPLTMSLRAARMAPSKMGFPPGALVTLDNALKMLMVKSPNDVAVMVAEGIDGSVESFADEMNATAQRLGMHESHFVNPNGLHDPAHVSSARDMALLGRALLRDFPEHADLFDIGAIQLDDAIIPNHNGLLGHYPGADGMKTGFTCSSGFNVVASATRNGRKLIAVVLGAPSARERTLEAAQLFERGFTQWNGGPTLESLAAVGGAAPDMRGEICSRRNAAAVAAAEEEFLAKTGSGPAVAPVTRSLGGRGGAGALASAPATEAPPAVALLSEERVRFDPVPVFVGPRAGWNGPVLAARDAGPTTSAAVGAAPAAPADATAYAPDKGASAAAQDAPMALQGAVKPPPPPAKATLAASKKPPAKAVALAIKPRLRKPKPKSDD